MRVLCARSLSSWCCLPTPLTHVSGGGGVRSCGDNVVQFIMCVMCVGVLEVAQW